MKCLDPAQYWETQVSVFITRFTKIIDILIHCYIFNAVGLLNNLGTGVYDLINEPRAAAIKGFDNFGAGVAKGVGSFVKNSVFGIANTASNITGSLGNVVASLSADPKYMSQRINQRINQPVHAGKGIQRAAESITKGVLDGVSGVLRSPVVGKLISKYFAFMSSFREFCCVEG